MKVAEMIKSLWMIVRSVIPLAGFLIIFQVLIFRKPLGDLKSLLLGIVMSVFGLFLFLKEPRSPSYRWEAPSAGVSWLWTTFF
jgi:hypothetical protein